MIDPWYSVQWNVCLLNTNFNLQFSRQMDLSTRQQPAAIGSTCYVWMLLSSSLRVSELDNSISFVIVIPYGLTIHNPEYNYAFDYIWYEQICITSD